MNLRKDTQLAGIRLSGQTAGAGLHHAENVRSGSGQRHARLKQQHSWQAKRVSLPNSDAVPFAVE